MGSFEKHQLTLHMICDKEKFYFIGYFYVFNVRDRCMMKDMKYK